MKKILLIIAGLLIVAVLAFFGLRFYTKSFSPEVVVRHEQNGIDVKVTYSKPAKKGRFIFGREQDGALLPYGKVWRTGANEATVIEFSQGVLFANNKVAAGKYSLWTIPNQGDWIVILNSEVGQWGTNYNDGMNILKASVPIRISPKIQELFSIQFEEQSKGANMILSWDQTEAVIPILPL